MYIEMKCGIGLKVFCQISDGINSVFICPANSIQTLGRYVAESVNATLFKDHDHDQ